MPLANQRLTVRLEKMATSSTAWYLSTVYSRRTFHAVGARALEHIQRRPTHLVLVVLVVLGFEFGSVVPAARWRRPSRAHTRGAAGIWRQPSR